LNFNYKVIKGVAEKSYGIDIIRNLKFPHKVIERAEKILSNLEI